MTTRAECQNHSMGPRTWPENWERRRGGEGCVMCAEGRPDVDDAGNLRFFAGRFTDAYFQRQAPSRGYSTVRWRGRHVADVSEMTAQELTDYWLEVAEVARALTEVLAPCHLNYELLGNAVPHVHSHIVPRYVDDASPNPPLKPWAPVTVPAAELSADAARLRAILTP
jgi:diadenosine tetraphosphate (Ap4A) HIT family hydrolase